MRAVLLLVQIFKAILCTQNFPPVWKHARVISILKPGKDRAQPSSYRPISLLDMIGKLFQKILPNKTSLESRRVWVAEGPIVWVSTGIVRPCSWPASLNEKPEISARGDWQFRCSRKGSKPSISFGSKTSFTSWPSLISRRTLSISFHHTYVVECSRRLSWRPRHHVAACGLGWRRVCQRHAQTLTPRQFAPLRSRYGHHSHVAHDGAARQLPAIVTQPIWTAADWRDNRHKRSIERRNHLRASRTALHSIPICDSFRWANQMGRYHSLSGADPGKTTYLVASHRTGVQENCSKDGFAGSSPEQEERALHQERSSAIQAAHPPPDG